MIFLENMVAIHLIKKFTSCLESESSRNTCLKQLDSVYIFTRYLFICLCILSSFIERFCQMLHL
jgi:hypothetical protein